jgi:hypothetical protein
LWQDPASLVPNSELQKWPQENWYPNAKPPLQSWLSATREPLDQDRLKAVGNIVMPKMAFMAMNVIGHDQLGLGKD